MPLDAAHPPLAELGLDLFGELVGLGQVEAGVLEAPRQHPLGKGPGALLVLDHDLLKGLGLLQKALGRLLLAELPEPAGKRLLDLAAADHEAAALPQLGLQAVGEALRHLGVHPSPAQRLGD